jgi:hypothetical protein
VSQTRNDTRYQMDVYFETTPEINAKQLEDSVNALEPDQEACSVTVAGAAELGDITPQEGVTITGFMVKQGGMGVMGLVHSVPSPGVDVIGASHLNDEQKQLLMAHRSFALLTLLGSEEADPREKLIFLYKIGAGLCSQGALGLGLPHSGVCIPGPFFLELIENTKTLKSEDGKQATLWRVIREDAIPEYLLMDIQLLPPPFLAPDADGYGLVITRGFSHLGFPDLMVLAESEKEANGLRDLFKAGYECLFAGRPAWALGHTMENSATKVVYRLVEPPDTFNPPFETFDLLLLNPESKPKKKLFGIFG